MGRKKSVLSQLLISEDVIQYKAGNFAIDYKPWDTHLEPQKYAEYGFEKGYSRALDEVHIDEIYQALKETLTLLPPNELTSLLEKRINELIESIDELKNIG